VVTAVAEKRVVSPSLVGRSNELDLLVHALSDPPAVVVVEGEAGIGKTRLVAELSSRPELGGRRIVGGGCRHVREPFPLGPLIDALRGVGDNLAGADLSPLTGALRPLIPELANTLPIPPEPLEERLAQRHRVFRALVEILGSLGAAVLVLEDLHWADEQTIDFISYLLGDLPAKLAVVLTFRSEEAQPRVRALTARVPDYVRPSGRRLSRARPWPARRVRAAARRSGGPGRGAGRIRPGTDVGCRPGSSAHRARGT
jgi:predicted ATPase